MRRPKLTVVTAGLSQPSSTRLLADRLAAATERALGARGVEVTVEFIELREHAHDVTNAALSGFPSPRLREVVTNVIEADGLIAVTPIINASYSGLFKAFFDVLDADALSGKPVLISATGGTERHSLALEHALRPLFSHLKAVAVPTAVYAASADWGPGKSDDGALVNRIERAASELADQMSRNPSGGPADPFDDVMSFEELLLRD